MQMERDSLNYKPSYERAIKDIATIRRTKQLHEHFELDKNIISVNNQNSTLEIILYYFHYTKDNRTLNRAFNFNVIFVLDYNYPFSKPCMIVTNQSEQNSYLRQINESLNKYCKNYWTPACLLTQILQQFIIKIQHNFSRFIISKPFKIEYQNTQQRNNLSLEHQVQIKQVTQKKIRKAHNKRKLAPANSNTETKNLNRHFRSKLRQILRIQVNNDPTGQKQVLLDYFKPNRVGFKQIRHALKTEWFNKILKQQMRNGQFLRRILMSVMNVESKMLMLKYYPIMEEAVENPKQFLRWKY